MVPDELRYTDQHEWLAATEDGTARVGITHYAQDQLGDVVFVQLPSVGERAGPGDALGEVESTKSVSDVYTPIAGEVVAVNTALTEHPELVNSDPYGDGWMFELRPEDPSAVDSLLDAAGYRALLSEA